MLSEVQGSSAHGSQMAKYFRLARAPSIALSFPSKPQISVTRLTSEIGLEEQTDSIPHEQAFVVSTHLTPASSQGCEIWVDDRYSRIANWPAGGVGIYDLETNPRTRNRGPVDWVHYHIPRSTLDEFADENGIARIETLKCEHGTVDHTLHHLTQSILPSFASEQVFCRLFLDYFRLLLCSHIMQRYSPSLERTDTFRGGLAPWQKRRVVGLFREDLDGQIGLPMLARECGLSVSHFTRSFRRSFGTSAHRYLVVQRIEQAKSLLSSSTSALTDVALQAGFSDQASFTRAFKAVVGIPPGHWRRKTNVCAKRIGDLKEFADSHEQCPKVYLQ